MCKGETGGVWVGSVGNGSAPAGAGTTSSCSTLIRSLCMKHHLAGLVGRLSAHRALCLSYPLYLRSISRGPSLKGEQGYPFLYLDTSLVGGRRALSVCERLSLDCLGSNLASILKAETR